MAFVDCLVPTHPRCKTNSGRVRGEMQQVVESVEEVEVVITKKNKSEGVKSSWQHRTTQTAAQPWSESDTNPVKVTLWVKACHANSLEYLQSHRIARHLPTKPPRSKPLCFQIRNIYLHALISPMLTTFRFENTP